MKTAADKWMHCSLSGVSHAMYSTDDTGHKVHFSSIQVFWQKVGFFWSDYHKSMVYENITEHRMSNVKQHRRRWTSWPVQPLASNIKTQHMQIVTNECRWPHLKKATEAERWGKPLTVVEERRFKCIISALHRRGKHCCLVERMLFVH